MLYLPMDLKQCGQCRYYFILSQTHNLHHDTFLGFSILRDVAHASIAWTRRIQSKATHLSYSMARTSGEAGLLRSTPTCLFAGYNLMTPTTNPHIYIRSFRDILHKTLHLHFPCLHSRHHVGRPSAPRQASAYQRRVPQQPLVGSRDVEVDGLSRRPLNHMQAVRQPCRQRSASRCGAASKSRR